MAFTPYTPTRQGPRTIGATALNTGTIQLTQGAFRALGEPAFVAVDVDTDSLLIRVRLATPGDPQALAIQQQRRFAATRLLRTAGIAYRPKSVPLPGRMVGRTALVLDYGDAPSRQVAA